MAGIYDSNVGSHTAFVTRNLLRGRCDIYLATTTITFHLRLPILLKPLIRATIVPKQYEVVVILWWDPPIIRGVFTLREALTPKMQVLNEGGPDWKVQEGERRANATQEVVELQQGTARHVQVMNQRLHSAEQRLKQMV
ncbi:hypothetical protein GOBAR_DD15946 [Gossypium barbadense]|nr:hypothetical protein GOBAR_DD15946 [Gossypium barbadense]